MTTQHLSEIVTLGGHQFAVDGVGHILEAPSADADNDADNRDAKPMPRDDNEPPEREAEKIVSDCVDWLLTIAVSPDNEKNRRTKMAELLREFVAKIAPHAKLYTAKDADASKAAAAESKAAKMLAAAGLACLSESTARVLVNYIREGDTANAKAFIADWSRVARNGRQTAAVNAVESIDEAIELLRG